MFLPPLRKEERIRKSISTSLPYGVAWDPEKGFIETPFQFPTVRRIFPSLIASEIVKVQPMTLPAGLKTFYLDYEKDESKTNDDTGDDKD